MNHYEFSTEELSVERYIEAAMAVAKDATAKQADRWDLVSFSVVRMYRSDGSPLEGAYALVVYRRLVSA